MSSYVAIKVSLTEYKHFKVDKDVQTYIIQLEIALRDGEDGLKRMAMLYPERFKNK